MKRITIYADQWGPNFLQSPNTGKRCCLGFACEQLGAKHIQGLRLPTDLYFDGAPEQVLKFASETKARASDELLAAATKLTGEPGYALGYYSLGLVLASVNDWFHKKRGRKAELLEPTLKVLRMGFKEMGYQLVYKKAA